MNSEDILKAAQHESQEQGEFENSVTRKALAYGTACGVAVLLVLTVLEVFVVRKLDFGKFAIIFAISGYSSLYEGRKLHIKKKCIAGIIELILALFGVLVFIGALFL